jgi:hypothetical protein
MAEHKIHEHGKARAENRLRKQKENGKCKKCNNTFEIPKNTIDMSRPFYCETCMREATKNIAGIEITICTNSYGEKYGFIQNFNGSRFEIVAHPTGDIYLKRLFDEPIDTFGTVAACVVVKYRDDKVSDSDCDRHIIPDAKMDKPNQVKLVEFVKEFDFYATA